MFPVTITLNNVEQLNAVMSAMGFYDPSKSVMGFYDPSKSVAEKKSVEESPPPDETKVTAATDSAATVTTAADTAAPESKVSNSVPALLDKDALTAATKAAIAKVGRDEVVALIASYGAAKGSEIATEKRAEFDAKLIALAA